MTERETQSGSVAGATAPGVSPAESGAEPASPLRRLLQRAGDRLTPRSRRHQVAYALLALLALLVFYVWRTSVSYPAQVFVMPAVEGSDLTVGLSPYDPERLDFGDLSQGTQGTTTLELENGSRIPLQVSIVATGSIRPFIRISDAFFVLKPGDEKEVEISAAIPTTAEPKEYSGRIRVVRVPWVPWP